MQRGTRGLLSPRAGAGGAAQVLRRAGGGVRRHPEGDPLPGGGGGVQPGPQAGVQHGRALSDIWTIGGGGGDNR